MLVGTGSEVHLCLGAADALAARGPSVRVVSLPCWEWFEDQDEDYRESVLPAEVPTLSVEAAASFGWERYADASVSIDTLAPRAPSQAVLDHFGFTVENVTECALWRCSSGPEVRTRPPEPTEPSVNNLEALYTEQGQSPWLDNLRRDWLARRPPGRARRRSGVRGVTSNPTIFAKAIAGEDDYDEQFALAHRAR